MPADLNLAEPVLESLGQAVVAVDMSRRIVYFNRKAEDLTGWTRDEALGSRCRQVMCGLSCQGGCLLERVMAGEPEVTQARGILVDRSGRRRGVSVCAWRLTDRQGRLAGVVETYLPLRQRPSLPAPATARGLGDFVTRDGHLQSILDVLPGIAQSDCTLLITGETGTGKDFLARLVHNLSPRGPGPFVKIGCAGLPEELLAGELFGYAAGGLSPGEPPKPGGLEQARQGTLFLDEVGELPGGLQEGLWSLLEERVYQPRGGGHAGPGGQGLPVRARLVAASNRLLEDLVREEGFREDLCYRLNLVRFHLPPLRERRVDLPLLIEHFLTRLSQALARRPRSLSDEALQVLLAYHYPGNLRELANILEQAVMVCQGPLIGLKELPSFLGGLARDSSGPNLDPTADSAERLIILEALTTHDWRRQAAAQALNMDRTTLWRKMKRHGLARPQAHGRPRG
ncbi:MAG: sigma 54-interacting transcriptional regulator [Pseudomonadota bacterium]